MLPYQYPQTHPFSRLAFSDSGATFHFVSVLSSIHQMAAVTTISNHMIWICQPRDRGHLKYLLVVCGWTLALSVCG